MLVANRIVRIAGSLSYRSSQALVMFHETPDFVAGDSFNKCDFLTINVLIVSAAERSSAKTVEIGTDRHRTLVPTAAEALPRLWHAPRVRTSRLWHGAQGHRPMPFAPSSTHEGCIDAMRCALNPEGFWSIGCE